MTQLERAACLSLFALASLGCHDDECYGHTSYGVVVAADEACPSVARIQSELDEDFWHEGERVNALDAVQACPPMTICWYRAELTTSQDPSCTYPSREELLSDTIARSGTIACDSEGHLYGEVLADGLTECPESSNANPWNFDLTTLVGFDEYPARIVCSYDVSYETSCHGAPKFGPL